MHHALREQREQRGRCVPSLEVREPEERLESSTVLADRR